MLRQTPTFGTTAANVGSLRDTPRTFPAFVAPDNHSYVTQSSVVSNRSKVTSQQPLQYQPGTHISNSENEDSVHTWIRLPAMPADSTHVTYPAYTTDEAVPGELRRALQEDDSQEQHTNGRSVNYLPHDSQYPQIEEEVCIL